METPDAQRTVLTAKILVESTGLTKDEHDRSVRWVVQQLKESAAFTRRSFVAVGVYDESGASMGFAGHGKQGSDETQEIVNEIFAA